MKESTSFDKRSVSVTQARPNKSLPKAEDYFDTPINDMDKFEEKVTKSVTIKRNNKYPRTELSKLNDQLEKYKVAKPVVAKS